MDVKRSFSLCGSKTTKATKTRSKQRQPSEVGMVDPFGRRVPLCFDRFMVALTSDDHELGIKRDIYLRTFDSDSDS